MMLSGEFEALLARLAAIPETANRQGPRCACGAELIFWHGAHTGYEFIKHPRNGGRVKCPRDSYLAWGRTNEEAMQTYVAKAPDIGALDAPAEDAPPEYEFEA